MSFLTFRYRYDGTPTHVLDDFGWLEMRVVTESRSGVGGFWVQWQDVKEFGEKLSAYPIDPNAPFAEQWGYSENGEYEKVLGVEIVPANARGDLTVRVAIADPDDPTDCVKTSFQTNYPAEAEDLVQEVLISVHERRNSFDCARPFTPWLFAIARHKMIDHFRRLRTHEPIDRLDQRPADDNFEPAVVARLDVAALLDTLPEKQACAIRHTRLQGLSVPEAARAARIGESDVKVSAHRGLRALAARVAMETQPHNRLDAAR